LQHKWVVASCLSLAALSLWFRSAVPVYGIGYAAHDDLLFVRLAYYLGAGQWLGPYDQLTLAKGMAFPAFIVAAFAAGIPLKIAEQALYLAAGALAAWLIWRLTRRACLTIVLFGVLAFNPQLWTSYLARVTRDGIYVSLSLAVVVLLAAVLMRREMLSSTARVALLLVLGVVAGLFWLTREEGIWLLPAAAFLLVAAAGRAITQNWESRSWRAGFRKIAILAGLGVIPAAVSAGVLGAVAAMNARQYGAFTTNEFQSAAFRAAYGAISRIKHDDWQRYIVFPPDAREKAYSVSAAARELRPTLDGEVGEHWRLIGCTTMQMDACNSIPAGWFVWAFRDAVAAAGHYSSARDALAFYRRLAEEINGACNAGRIACGPPRASLAPPFRLDYVRDALALLPTAAKMLVDPVGVGTLPSEGPHFALELFADLVGPLASGPLSYEILIGSMSPAAELPELIIRDRDAAAFRSELRLTPQVDPKSQAATRTMAFELETDCLRPSCELVVRWGGNDKSFPIDQLRPGALVAGNDGTVTITHTLKRGNAAAVPIVGEMRKELQLPIASEMRRNMQLRIMRSIARAYAIALPFLIALAALGTILAIALRRIAPIPDGMLALVLACAVAVITRIALLAYIDVSAFHAVNPLYLAPATPLLLMLAVLGLYLGGRAGRAAYRGKRRPH
jgi:hypothetical protein